MSLLPLFLSQGYPKSKKKRSREKASQKQARASDFFAETAFSGPRQNRRPLPGGPENGPFFGDRRKRVYGSYFWGHFFSDLLGECRFRRFFAPFWCPGGAPGGSRGRFGSRFGRLRAEFPVLSPGSAGVVPGNAADLRYSLSGVPLGYGDLPKGFK